MNTQQIDLPDSTEKFNTPCVGAGAGAGLASMAHALRDVVAIATPHPAGLASLGAVGLAAAWYDGSQPAGKLMAQAQAVAVHDLAKDDMTLARRIAYKLARRMEVDGRAVGHHDIMEAAAAAAAGLVAWRNGGQPDGYQGDTTPGGAIIEPRMAIAWRAVVSVLSADNLGADTSPMNTFDDDCITAQAIPRESRAEQKSRWAIETTRAYWVHRLAEVRSNLAAGGGGQRRAEFVDRTCNALSLILGGETIDKAAEAAGFHKRDRHNAGDQLVRALSRLGFNLNGFAVRRR